MAVVLFQSKGYGEKESVSIRPFERSRVEEFGLKIYSGGTASFLQEGKIKKKYTTLGHKHLGPSNKIMVKRKCSHYLFERG
jgi:hypothetical protein